MSTGYYPDNYNITNTTIIVRADVTVIEADAFRNFSSYDNNTQTKVYTFIFESNTTLLRIEDYAFYSCNMDTFILPSSVTSIGNYAFCFCNMDTFILPSSVTSIGNYAFSSTNFNSFTFASNNNLLTIGDSAFTSFLTKSDFIIPTSVTSIGNICFSVAAFRAKCIMNCKITEIPLGAFSFTHLEALYFNEFFASLPNTITKINDEAFYQFYFDKTILNSDFTDISFNIYIPSRVTYIGSNAYSDFFKMFDFTNEFTIYIPNRVTYLAPDAIVITDFNDPGYLIPTSIKNFSSYVSLDPTLFPGLSITNAPVCFLVNTKILTMQSNNKEKYVSIQDLRKGDLVKTLENEYKKIDVIGHSIIEHRIDNQIQKNRLYVCSTNKYAELFEDLVMTGCHSILVNKLTDKQRAETMEMTGRIYITGNRYRLFACLDEKTTVYPTDGDYEIWHFALENNDEKGNYGVYANGLLVESCSKRTMHEFSGMQLV